MHERSVASQLVRQAAEIVERSGADRAVSVGIRFGCLSELSEPHLRSQFAAAAEGTALEDALLQVSFSDETLNSESLDVVLTHVEVADPA
jgi:Zn finger protein HypA/HybF involved in hydrogenase expression